MISKTKQGEPMYKSFKQRIRLSENLPSPTQICGGIRPQFQFGHPTQPRGLTIRERARIQTFPDNYFFSGGIVQVESKQEMHTSFCLKSFIETTYKNV